MATFPPIFPYYGFFIECAGAGRSLPAATRSEDRGRCKAGQPPKVPPGGGVSASAAGRPVCEPADNADWLARTGKDGLGMDPPWCFWFRSFRSTQRHHLHNLRTPSLSSPPLAFCTLWPSAIVHWVLIFNSPDVSPPTDPLGLKSLFQKVIFLETRQKSTIHLLLFSFHRV